MTEKLVGEIAFDPEFKSLYLGVREHKLEDGSTVGVIVASGDNEDQVREAIEMDRMISSEIYHLFKPDFKDGGRVGEIIGGTA